MLVRLKTYLAETPDDFDETQDQWVETWRGAGPHRKKARTREDAEALVRERLTGRRVG